MKLEKNLETVGVDETRRRPMYLLLVILFLSIFLLFSIGLNMYLYDQNQKLERELSTTRFEESQGKKSSTSSVLFNKKPLETGSVFNFSPDEPCVGDIKAKFIGTTDNSASIEVVERQMMDKNFYPLEVPETFLIEDGACLEAVPHCLDVSYDYCFTVTKADDVLNIEYSLKSESTMLGDTVE